MTGGDRPEEAGDVTDKGLREVVAADTQISDIDGDLGRLWYVGYDIVDLAQHASYEEVVHLLHHLDLPTRDQLDELNEFLIDERDLSPFLANLMHELAQQTSPMSMLRTGISAASAYDPDGWDESADAQLRKALRLIAKGPSLITHYHRLRTGQDVIPSNPKLPHAANFLWMLLGDEPSAEDADTLDTTFVLYADHTMNASTFTARIIASTLADMFSAITGAVAALKGPLHGGANEEAMKMLEEIGSPDRAEAYVRNRLEHHEKIMGFGHAVYRTMDPRARILKQMADAVFEVKGRTPLIEVALELERIALEDDYFVKRKLYPNVDFYSGLIYQAMAFPMDMFPVLFAIPRVSGWLSQWQEMLEDPDQKIARPRQIFTGYAKRDFVPLSARG